MIVDMHTSDNPPQKERTAVDASEYPVPIHTQLPPGRSLTMVGRTVDIPVRSKADKNKEMKAETIMNQTLLSRLLLPSASAADMLELVIVIKERREGESSRMDFINSGNEI